MNRALDVYERVKDICKDVTVKKDKFIVQVVKSTVETMKLCTLFKAVLLDRKVLLDGTDVSAFDEILLSMWLEKEDAELYKSQLDYIEKMFKFGKILELQKIAFMIVRTNERKEVAHEFSISLDFSTRNETIIEDNFSFEMQNTDLELSPICFEDYKKYFPFHITTIETAIKTVKEEHRKTGKPKTSICLSLFGRVFVKMPERRKNARFLHFSMMDETGHIANVAAFNDTIDLLHFEENDYLLLKPVSVSIDERGVSFIVNQSTMFIVNPMHNMALRDAINKTMVKSMQKHISDDMYVDSYRLRKEHAVLKRTLEQVQDENSTLCEMKKTLKSYVQNVSIQSIDLTGMFKYQCRYVDPNTGMNCMKTVNPYYCHGKVRWVCTRKRPDNSMPFIPGFTDEEKREKKFYGHIELEPSIKMYAKMQISDPTVGAVDINICHNAIEQLFKMQYREIASLPFEKLNLLVADILDDPDNKYYINTTSRFKQQQTNDSMYDNNCFFQIDYINKEN